MKKPTIAFTVITKNKPDKLVRLLDSTKGVFDYYCLQDTGSVDNTSIEAWIKWCKDNKKEYVTDKKEYPSVEVNGVQILADFSMARNDSLKLAKNLKADFIFWCDTDDVIMNAEALPEIASVMQKEGLKIAFMKYNYAMPDENGKVASEQWRERLYSLHTKNLKWAEPVHENLIADDVQGLGFKCSDVVVQHMRTAEETIETGRRNKLIMEKYFNDHGLKNTSLQLIRNYAYDAYEHREYTTAIKFYKLAIKRHLKEKDPMPEFLHDCYAKLFRCYMDKKMFKRALEISSRMVALMPKLAEPYMRSAEAYLMLGANELAISSAEVAIKIGKPQTLIPINEIEFQDLPRRIIAEAHLAMGNLQGAIAEYQDLYKLTGSSVYYRRLQELSRHADNERVVKAINTLQLHFEDEGYFDKLQYLSQTIPEDIKEQPLVKRMLTEIEADTERKLTPHKVTGKKKIVFYVGGGFEVWTPENIKQGIGGSEEMVINLARELAKLGNEVEVYNECRGKEGDYEGVKYIHHSKVDQIKADVLIVSRQPQAFDRIWDAKKQYLWLHDTYYGEQTRRRFNLADKVLVLTNAHKDIIKNAYGVKDSQFQVTRNGVDLGILPKEIDEANRNPHRLFWGSSYDRGLLELLEMWGDIKTQVPDAELHFCYGWNTFDAMMDARQGTEEGERMRQYKNKVLELLEKHKDTGIIDLGRVGQDKQLEIMATCGIWAYPTWFSEISCITAMKAQMVGTIPVVTPVSALKETVKYGIKVGDERLAMRKDKKTLDMYKDALISLMKDTKRQEMIRPVMMEKSRELFRIDKLAEEWNKLFEN